MSPAQAWPCHHRTGTGLPPPRGAAQRRGRGCPGTQVPVSEWRWANESLQTQLPTPGAVTPGPLGGRESLASVAGVEGVFAESQQSPVSTQRSARPGGPHPQDCGPSRHRPGDWDAERESPPSGKHMDKKNHLPSPFLGFPVFMPQTLFFLELFNEVQPTGKWTQKCTARQIFTNQTLFVTGPGSEGDAVAPKGPRSPGRHPTDPGATLPPPWPGRGPVSCHEGMGRTAPLLDLFTPKQNEHMRRGACQLAGLHGCYQTLGVPCTHTHTHTRTQCMSIASPQSQRKNAQTHKTCVCGTHPHCCVWW